MKATPGDWKWLAELLESQEHPDSVIRERMARLVDDSRDIKRELERKPLAFIEQANDMWILGQDPAPIVAPDNVKHGFWIIAFALQHPGEDISVAPFAMPGDGSTTETLASYISRARGFIVTHRPELEPHLRAIKFCRESETARYTPPPSAPPLRFA